MPEEQPLSGLSLTFLSVAIGISAFLVSLDALIVNVAIPTISGELGVREDVGAWIITLFSMASTLCVPLSGWLAVKFGSARLFIYATLFYAFISLLCGLAHDFTLLLFLRIFQGAGGGIITPLSLSLIIATFPENRRSVAIGFWSFFVMVGPAMGPMIGGWLSDSRWPWLFYLNVPPGIFSAFVTYILLRGRKDPQHAIKLDWIGVLLLFTGMGALQVALNRGNIDDWFRSPFIFALFIVSGIALVFFITWEAFHASPFFEVKQFRKLNFSLASFSVGIGMMLLFSSFILDSLWVQEVLGYTPAWAGLTLAPVGFFPLIFYPIIGKIVSKLDLRIWIAMSFILYACTFFWLSRLNTDATYFDLALPRLVQGIGFAIFTVPNSLIAIRNVTEDKMIFIISLFSFMRMIFVGLGIPLALTLWSRRETFYQSRYVEKTYPNNPIFQQFLDIFRPLNLKEEKLDALANQAIFDQSSTLGLTDIYYLYGWLFVILLFVVFFYRLPRKTA